MVVDETLYVLGMDFQSGEKVSDTVKYYNHEDNKWIDKATVPVNKITKTRKLGYYFRGCSLRVFKRVLSNLECIDLSG